MRLETSVVEVETVRFRPLSREDLAITMAWYNDPALSDDILGDPFPITEALESTWLERRMTETDRRRVTFAVEDVTAESLIGIVQLTEIDWLNRHAHLGMLIGNPDSRGKGFGRAMLETLLRYAFERLNLRKILLQVAAYNQAARALYDQAGFAVEGRLREQTYRAGAYHEVLIMALFADDWRKTVEAARS